MVTVSGPAPGADHPQSPPPAGLGQGAGFLSPLQGAVRVRPAQLRWAQLPIAREGGRSGPAVRAAHLLSSQAPRTAAAGPCRDTQHRHTHMQTIHTPHTTHARVHAYRCMPDRMYIPHARTHHTYTCMCHATHTYTERCIHPLPTPYSPQDTTHHTQIYMHTYTHAHTTQAHTPHTHTIHTCKCARTRTPQPHTPGVCTLPLCTPSPP